MATVDKIELGKLLDFVIENEAWAESIKQALIIAANHKLSLKVESKEYWDKIILKYNLDPKKIYNIDQKTGDITEVIVPVNPVPVKKGEANE